MDLASSFDQALTLVYLRLVEKQMGKETYSLILRAIRVNAVNGFQFLYVFDVFPELLDSELMKETRGKYNEKIRISTRNRKRILRN